MPPSAVKTVKDVIYWQYAKIISASAGIGKTRVDCVQQRKDYHSCETCLC